MVQSAFFYVISWHNKVIQSNVQQCTEKLLRPWVKKVSFFVLKTPHDLNQSCLPFVIKKKTFYLHPTLFSKPFDNLNQFRFQKGLGKLDSITAFEFIVMTTCLDPPRLFSELMCVSLSGECTFEAFLGSLSHTCGWTQDTTDDFQWTRASGSTASYQTGPAFDHTYGTKQGKKCWIMIFFCKYLWQAPLWFWLSKSYNLSYFSKYPYSLTVTGPSAIIASNSGNNFSHNWVFFWSHIKKNSEQSR